MVGRRKSGFHFEKALLGRLLATAALFLLAGCGIGSERKDPLEIEVQRMEREKAALVESLEQAEEDKALLAQQIEALSVLGVDRPLALYDLREVRITKYTNFYDKNSDGQRENLIVYFQPIDTAGDVVKAAGAVEIQLWDLNAASGEALLGEWNIEPDELHESWFQALISSSYRLVFDAPESAEVMIDPLTIKVTFTSYLTGEIFHAQRTIDPTQ